MRVHGIARMDIKPTFRSQKSYQMFSVVGITKDSTGAALGGCAVNLFDTELNCLLKNMVSDANGNYSFQTSPGKSYYVVAYKAGDSPVAGTTVNTLVGA